MVLTFQSVIYYGVFCIFKTFVFGNIAVFSALLFNCWLQNVQHVMNGAVAPFCCIGCIYYCTFVVHFASKNNGVAIRIIDSGVFWLHYADVVNGYV